MVICGGRTIPQVYNNYWSLYISPFSQFLWKASANGWCMLMCFFSIFDFKNRSPQNIYSLKVWWSCCPFLQGAWGSSPPRDPSGMFRLRHPAHRAWSPDPSGAAGAVRALPGPWSPCRSGLSWSRWCPNSTNHPDGSRGRSLGRICWDILVWNSCDF